MTSQSPLDQPTLKLRPLAIGPVVIDPPVLQAPMAGFTNYAYRQIIRQFGGVGLPATEMVSARGFLQVEARNDNFPDRLWGVLDEPRPLAVQIWDNNPENLARVGARLAHEFRVSVIDINFGCPAKEITRAQSGSYLLRDPQLIGNIVSSVVEACRPVPVTAKIRLGLTRDAVNAADVAQAVEDAGGAALTVHGRTVQDLFRGRADWDAIAHVKPYLRKIPLIGNGDLATAAAVVAEFRRYDLDGVMIGRAALHRPWLFREVHAALTNQPIPPEPTLEEQRQLLLAHYEAIVAHFGERKGTVLMRKYACCYAQGRPHARQFRAQVAQVATRAEFLAVVELHFPRNHPPAD